MKIRSGFVSNSSSSSFMVYGLLLDTDANMNSIVDAIIADPTCTEIKSIEDADGIERYELLEYVENMVKEPYTVERYSDDIVIGIDPSNMNIDKTLRESMNEVKAYTRKMFGDNIPDSSYGWYEDCSYDG